MNTNGSHENELTQKCEHSVKMKPASRVCIDETSMDGDTVMNSF
jgi:hypothetical protein